MTDVLLSGEQVKKIIARPTKILAYGKLRQYDRIQDLLNQHPMIILLYVNEPSIEGQGIVGHWNLLAGYRQGGDTIVEVMDPYGRFIDYSLDQIPDEINMEQNQENAWLCELLLKFKNESPKHIVKYNELPLQKLKPNINTCGRIIALRGHFIDIPLEKYQKWWMDQKKDGHDLDQLAVSLSDKLHGSKIISS